MLTISFLTSKSGLSPPQKREVDRLLTNLPIDCIVHGGGIGGDEVVDWMAYQKRIYRRVYTTGFTSPSNCGLFTRRGRIEFMRPKPDPQRMLYVIGDGDLVIACPGNGGIGRLTQEAFDRNKPIVVLSLRGFSEEFNGVSDLLSRMD